MNFTKNMKLFGTVCSGLLINSLIIPQAVLAQETTSKLNPCPGLLYEEPSVPTTPSPYQVWLGVGGEAPAPSVLNPNPGFLVNGIIILLNADFGQEVIHKLYQLFPHPTGYKHLDQNKDKIPVQFFHYQIV
jgi:hypothetical protein